VGSLSIEDAQTYKCLRDGRSLIIAIVIPGDVSDLDILSIGRVDHEMACLTAVVAAELPQETFDAFFDGSHPRITQAIEERAILSNAIQREGMVNVGLRTAPERIAHLFCELFHRMRARGLTDGDRFTMPLTQNNIADAVGLSLVHVNRRLQDLRTSKLVSLRHRQLIVHDLPALQSLAFFDPAYLGVHNRVDTHLHRDTAPSFS
jgi:CRP-like cAMP-binding protein